MNSKSRKIWKIEKNNKLKKWKRDHVQRLYAREKSKKLEKSKSRKMMSFFFLIFHVFPHFLFFYFSCFLIFFFSRLKTEGEIGKLFKVDDIWFSCVSTFCFGFSFFLFFDFFQQNTWNVQKIVERRCSELSDRATWFGLYIRILRVRDLWAHVGFRFPFYEVLMMWREDGSGGWTNEKIILILFSLVWAER